MFRAVRGGTTAPCCPKDLQKLKKQVPELVTMVCKLVATYLGNREVANTMPFVNGQGGSSQVANVTSTRNKRAEAGGVTAVPGRVFFTGVNTALENTEIRPHKPTGLLSGDKNRAELLCARPTVQRQI